MKLKTLKDLNQFDKDWDCENKPYNWCISKQEIKQEAIKWVKGDRERFGLTIQGEFWQRRFNITEEELKSEDKKDEINN